ncbi:MAG: Na(+)-translocating NADH-quinone reductase subunit F [Flavobacteriaceae bacterium]|nr:Na(+)-translocating NADH-quinone reductase subunit F [Flavobacteriaceae bacterium]
MKRNNRFETAVQKLYEAFHNDELNPECCKHCAVGNILDQTDSWKQLSNEHGSLNLNYVGLVHQRIGRTFNGYSPQELLEIEVAFLKGCGYEVPLGPYSKKPFAQLDKDLLFQGLCKTVEKLCDLEGIPSIMDYSELFQYKISSTSTSSEILVR